MRLVVRVQASYTLLRLPKRNHHVQATTERHDVLDRRAEVDARVARRHLATQLVHLRIRQTIRFVAQGRVPAVVIVPDDQDNLVTEHFRTE